MTTHERASGPAAELETFHYSDKAVRQFAIATIVWGVVGMLVGLILAFELINQNLNLGLPYLTFGRLRPLHTNTVIFAFVGNAIFAGSYYATQRLCKARIFSDLLSSIHFWGWQLIIVSAAITLPLGITAARSTRSLSGPSTSPSRWCG